MGTDISGFVEVRPHQRRRTTTLAAWEFVADLDHLYDGRSYDLFGCLFGVRNFAGFRPVAAGRGLPEDLSSRGAAEWKDWCQGAHDPTWITWAELAAIDLDEPAERPDLRYHHYRRTADGELTRVSKFSGGARVTELIAASGMTPADGAVPWPEGTEWSDGDDVYRIERLVRRDVLPGCMSVLWKVMAALAELHGPEHVRLVVYFDS
ncbi:MAG TPA: hypothetical protein VGF17_30665 [Phytomonospora sp.]